MISRRAFLIGSVATAAWAITPAFADRALDWFVQKKEPLLTPPKRPKTVLLARYDDANEQYGGLQIIDPTVPEWPTTPWTYREHFERYGDPDTTLSQWLSEQWGDDPEEYPDLDGPIDYETYVDNWCVGESPNALGFFALWPYADALGPWAGEDEYPDNYVSFVECPGMASNYYGVHASDPVGLSLLQHRLNQLDAGIEIKFDPEAMRHWKDWP